MKKKISLHKFLVNKPYVFLVIVFFICFLILQFEFLYDEPFGKLMSVSSFLTWHVIFEFTSILISLSIFFVTYYTYSQNHNLRSIFLGFCFLIIAMVDVFHTMSYKGMPDFFISNSNPNRATLLWIFSSLLTAIMYLFSSFIPVNKKYLIKKSYILITAFTIGAGIFIVSTYFPQFLPAMHNNNGELTSIKIVFEYISMALFLFAMIRFLREYNNNKDYLLVLIAAALLLRTFSSFAFTNYKSVYGIYNYFGHIYKTISFFIIFRVLYIYSVQKPYIELKKSQRKLKLYLSNLNKIVDKRTMDLRSMNKKFIDDLNSAKDIQQSMLPKQMPYDLSVSFDFNFFPAERVSGDFYDIFRLDNERIGFYVADVSGHGVSASMLTVFLKQSIEVVKYDEGNNASKVLNPSEVLRNLYTNFNNTRFKDEMYIVIFYGILNTVTKELTYCSAGFNTEPVLLKKDGEISLLPLNGFPICKFIEYYTPRYKDLTVSLDSKDRLLIYSDGLVENRNSKNEPFGEERLIQLFNNIPKNSNLGTIIKNNIFSFIGKDGFKDDITYLIIEMR